MNSQIVLMEKLGEHVFSLLHKCVMEQFTIKTKSEDLFALKSYRFTFKTSYSALSTSEFYEYVLVPEMVVQWIKSEKGLTKDI